MAERIKVYEENNKKGLPVWAWLLPLLLLLALLIYLLAHRHSGSTASVPTAAPIAQSAGAGVLPELGTVHFETNKATLTPDGQATLERAAESMKANPGVHLRLEGYTDSTGSLPHNATLSQQRALTVANFLKAQGIDGARLTGSGFGPSNPSDTNATAAGKADNRRVELFTQQ